MLPAIKLQNMFALLFLTVIVFQFLSPVASSDQICRALVLQGGGDKGAYEAGVLYGLVNNARNPDDFKYDVITGVSVGAINGMCLAMYEKGDEHAAVDYLVNAWRGSSKKQVYKNWPLGPLQGLFKEPSIFNNDPEIDFLRSKITSAPNKRKITVVSTDINTGERIVNTEQDWGNNATAAADYALFSSSIPILFKYRNFKNYTLIDGGTAGEGLDIEDAVRRCREIVDEDANIVIDVIFANNITTSRVEAEKFKSLEVLGRYGNIMKYVFSTRALHYAQTYYKNVDFRYVVMASEKLPHQEVPLDFDPKNIEKMIQLGIKDGIDAINGGIGQGRRKIAQLPKNFIKNKASK